MENIVSAKIEIGDLVQIERPDGKVIQTKVENLQDNEIWTFDFLNEIIWVEDWKEQAFSVRIVKDGRCFAFLGYISGNETVDGHKMTKIVRLSPIEEVQRRTAYRLKYMFDVFMREVDENGETEEDFIKCQGLDISETGLGLNASTKWAVGDHVECMFRIKGVEFHFVAKVVRRLDWVMAGQYIYRIGLEFAEEDERQMREIRRFIFSQQVARD